MIAQTSIPNQTEPSRWIEWGSGTLARSGVPNPKGDAESLLSHLLGCRRIDLYLDPPPLPDEIRNRFRFLIQKRSRREPLQYILRETSFFGRSFSLGPEVLIPRFETELLVEECLKRSEGTECVMDVGTGSGCIAITLACELPGTRIMAVDASLPALERARKNGERHGVTKQIFWICGSLLEAFGTISSLDMIVANLPYIPESELHDLQPEVGRFEPWSALNGGPDGLSLIRRLIRDAHRVLRKGGLLALEIGQDQGGAVLDLIMKTGSFEKPELKRDLSGSDRMVFAIKSTR